MARYELRDYVYKSLLDEDKWTSALGDRYIPSQGRMGIDHICNTQRYLLEHAEIIKNEECMHDQAAANSYLFMDVDTYIELRIKPSILWLALLEGERKHKTAKRPSVAKVMKVLNTLLGGKPSGKKSSGN